MTINLKIPDIREMKPRITVFGVGGAGGNAVNNMISAGLPEAAKGPAFAVAAGLLGYPQAAHLEHFEPRKTRQLMTGTGGYMARVGQWLRESF